MSKASIVLSLIALVLAGVAINEYDSNAECYELITLETHKADVRFNKCTGRAHMLVLDDTPPYVSVLEEESAEKDKGISYFQWVSIPTADGIAISQKK